MNKSNNKQLVDKLMENLENLALEEDKKITDKKASKHIITYVTDLLEVLNTSKLAFAEAYVEKTPKEQALFRKNISIIIGNEKDLNQILSETKNLYHLKKANLLNNEFTKSQQQTAERWLGILSNRLIAYLRTTNKRELEEDIKTHEKRIKNIFTLASKYEDGVLQDEIENIQAFSDILEHTELTLEDQEQLIKTALLKNVTFYKRNLKQRDLTREKELTEQREKALEEASKKTPVKKEKEVVIINEEILNELDELLSNKEVVERIVKIIDLEFALTINFNNPTKEDQETINSIVDIAKEEILETIASNKTLTPYEALQEFYQNNSIEKELETIQENYLGYQAKESILAYEEQLEVINKAKEFVKTNEEVLNNLTSTEKEKTLSLMQTVYNDFEKRLKIYQSKYQNNYELNLIKEASLEISTLLKNIDDLLKDKEKNKVIISKTVARFTDIFKALEMITTKSKQEEVKETKTEKESENKLFFLLKTEDRTFLEEDINFNSDNKGISNNYYKIINQLLLNVKNKNKEQTGRENSSVYLGNDVKKMHVGRGTIFYYPLSTDNILILGCGIYDTKDNRIFINMQKRFDDYKASIMPLKELAKKNQIPSSALTANKEIEERIFTALNRKKNLNEDNDEILREMLTKPEEENEKVL